MDESRLGLYSGFEEYRSTSPDDYRNVLLNGLVVPDANVLLDLYRYQAQTRNDLLNALRRLNTLWLPHQVMREFWDNRLTTIRESRGVTKKTIDNLPSKAGPLIAEINEWANIRGARLEIKDELTSIVRQAVDLVVDRLKQIADSEAAEVPEETFQDPVLIALDPLIEGKVGARFDEDREEREKESARRRIELRIPPGFEDRQKGEKSHGDYFVWAQLLEEAERRRSDVLFVTRDKKPDWWRKSGSDIVGPRGELVRELMSRTGGKGRLYFLTPERFLSWTEALLGVKVSEGTIIDIERVESQQSSIHDAMWSTEELAVFDGLQDRSDERTAIEQLPEGAAEESYFDVLVRLCSLIGGERESMNKFLDKFQAAFPNITLRSEARRRASCLFKLGLAQRSGDVITLTPRGLDIVATRNLELAQAAFLEKIKGAKELASICAESASTGVVRAKLKNENPPGISQNQAVLVLRWLEQLQII